MSRMSGRINLQLPELRNRAALAPTAELPKDHESRPWFRIQNSSEDETDIYIFDEIDPFWGIGPQEIIRQLKEVKSGRINLHIDSPGGSMFDGVAIYNAFVRHDATVHVFVDGLAASAASFIAQAGDTVTMSQGSMMMIHDAAAIVYGNAADMEETASLLNKASDGIAGIYATRAGEDADFWRALMRSETWYNAQEAVDVGLADNVDTTKKAEPVENRFNLSVFQYAGRAAAPSPAAIRQRIANTVKETSVPGSKLNSPKTETQEPVQPEQPNPEEQETGEEQQAEQQPPAPEAAPTTPPDQPDPSARTGSVLVNGVATTDMRAIQTHINVLETFRMETQRQARRDFVTQLGNDRKVSPTQIGNDDEGLTNFALSLDEKAFEAWKKTWDAAPSLSLFGVHAGPSATPDPQQSSEAEATANKVAEAQEIIRNHRRGGMRQEQIEKTPSWKVLVANNATDF